MSASVPQRAIVHRISFIGCSDILFDADPQLQEDDIGVGAIAYDRASDARLGMIVPRPDLRYGTTYEVFDNANVLRGLCKSFGETWEVLRSIRVAPHSGTENAGQSRRVL